PPVSPRSHLRREPRGVRGGSRRHHPTDGARHRWQRAPPGRAAAGAPPRACGALSSGRGCAGDRASSRRGIREGPRDGPIVPARRPSRKARRTGGPRPRPHPPLRQRVRRAGAAPRRDAAGYRRDVRDPRREHRNRSERPAGCGVSGPGFRAGTGRTTITPPLTVPHAGWGARTPRFADDVETDLWATVLVLADNQEMAAVVDVDLVAVAPEDAAAIRAEVARVLKLAPEKVRVTETHNHAGPPNSHWAWMAEGV